MKTEREISAHTANIVHLAETHSDANGPARVSDMVVIDDEKELETTLYTRTPLGRFGRAWLVIAGFGTPRNPCF